MSRFVLIAVAALVGLAASGCDLGSSDRAGGDARPKRVVLTLATHATGADVREWIDAVQRRSQGALRIEVRSGWRAGEVGFEKATIDDVRAGKADLASVPARAYDTLGVTSFQGLLAPFLIDSYALERKVLASDVPEQLLAGVETLGVVGIALLPGALQRILSVGTAALAPSDYRGQTVGIRPSQLATSTFHALGTTSIEVAPEGDFSEAALIEQDLATLVAERRERLTADETLSSNVSFWPAATTVVVNAKTFAGLTSQQRAALSGADRAVLGPAMQRIARDEQAAVAAICRSAAEPRALQFLSATPSNVTALRKAVDPLYRRLETDDVTGGVIAAIEAMKKRVTREPAPRCTRDRPPRVGDLAAAGAIDLRGELTATTPTTWQGAVASKRLGRGRLVLSQHVLFRSKLVRRIMKFRARFAGGELRGCITMAIGPGSRGEYAWDGPGTIDATSQALRRYAGLSLRFAGITKAGDLRHVRGGFATDAPTGLPCH